MTDPTKKSQAQQILAYMKKGNSISPQKALEMFHCMRLAARIADIKKMGYEIETRTGSYVADGRTVKFAEYVLNE